MSLHLHRATRADALVAGLGRMLSEPQPDPFAAELVVTPSRGMERWLSQRLSHLLGAVGGADGVCAGVDFRSPASLVAEVTGTGEEDPWAPDALVWPLIEVIDGCLDQPWATTLARHLGHGLPAEEADLRLGRRFSVARRLAGLFASYAGQRPALVADWTAGLPTDGAGRRLDPDLVWQPELWRRLVERMDAPAPDVRHRLTIERLRENPEAFALPIRLSLFGHTRLSETEIGLLGGLAVHRDVHIWLPHPSPVLWRELAGRAGAVDRVGEDGHQLVTHPLLSTLGRDTRELQRALAVLETTSDVTEPAATAPGDDLLGWLQRDLSADELRPEGRLLAPGDRSVQVHACHGLARQVDVLREVLLGLLADDPTLEPRDVLVMCPDIETAAPLIEAGFGLGEVVGDQGHPAHRLRVRLADRSPGQTNPLLAVARSLLDLAGGRAEATQVLDLARSEPVRRRFGFTDDDLDQLDTWARESGVRWAFDAAHRADFGLSDYVANTWEFGLDRLLTGVALSDDSAVWLDRALPIDDVGSGQVDLVGRLVEYVDRLRAVTDRLTGRHPLGHWLDVLGDGIDALTAVPSADGWQSGQVQRELGRVRRAATGLGRVELRLPDVRALLSDRLAGRPTRANFRTGTLTVATLVPMRSVPHRVICLLGLDDGVFPRSRSVDGDDALARDPLTGERDARSEDRQLLLDAILAATQTLVVTYTGANEFSGQPRPPAVPLGEVLDALDLTATTDDGRPVSDAVTVHHPLQPFDARNVTADLLVRGEVFSFDRSAAAGARAAAGPRHRPAPFITGPLPARPRGDVQLSDLVRFWADPVKGFLQSGVDVALPAEQDQPEDTMPVEIDQLAQWAVGDRVLRDLLLGLEPVAAAQREWRRGLLPPGRLGWRLLDTILKRATPLRDAAVVLRTVEPRAVDVDVDLGDGRWLRGTVPEVYGDRLVPVHYSRLGGKHRLASWIWLLALTAADDDHNWTAHTVARPTNSRAQAATATSLLGPLDHTAVRALRDLVDLRDRGLCEPLPLPIKTSLGYARSRRTRGDAAEALVKAGYDWKDGRFPGEQSSAACVRAWGSGTSIPGRDERPGPGEEFAGETSRFGALAMRLWSPLIEAEQGELVMDPVMDTVIDTEMEPFDPTGPLPTGTTLLEASAGTGKTFTVGALVTRYVAEGVATLDQLLVITFGRAASQELRERVRDQLVQAERALARPDDADRSHPVVAVLLAGSDAEREIRRARLRDALATFDAATIATTHQFCHTVLRSLGVAGDTDPGTPLVESLDELVVEVVDDVYLRRFGHEAAPPPFSREQALALARTVVGDAHASLAVATDPEGAAGVRVAFAHEVRAEVERRKRRLGILAYDDLLGRLADALGDEDAPARQRMRQRWRIVLVDEFQDTDPKQWEVLDRAFSGHATLVLIGDPKQAIYAFRGGDVVTYLAAAATATRRATLDTNRRSDADLVERLQVVLRGAALGDPRIVVREVSAAHPGTRLVGAPMSAPFRIRQVRRDGFRLVRGNVSAGDARLRIADDCAGDIARLLASGATWDGEPIAAEHVAVLVAVRTHGELVRAALAERGIPAVVAGSGNVLTSPAGDDWLALLEALEQPHRSGRVRAAALTSFLGLTLAEVDAGGDELTDRLADRLRGWGLLVRGRGVAALFEATEERGLSARVLALVGGERLLTDLRHVAQTLHEAAIADQLGLTGLLEWLRTEREAASQERVRRLDSDAAAVQITTIHQSKGLQYPVVHLPFVSMKHVWDVDVARYHDADGSRMLDVAGSGRDWKSHVATHRSEEAGEELRDVYVALTRAQSQVVTWWAPTANTPSGGLHRLLFGRQPGQAEVPDTQDVKDDDYVARVLDMLSQLGGPQPEPAEVFTETPSLPGRAPATLAARDFHRPVDVEWRRTSYSGLIRVQEQPTGVTSEPEVEPLSDQPLDAEPGLDSARPTGVARPTGGPAPAVGVPLPSPMDSLPGGATLGSLVHAVLEESDPEAPDLSAELTAHTREQLTWWPVGVPAEEIATALLPSLHTPLGPLATGLRLVDLPLRDRLCELDFEFPLSGGDLPTSPGRPDVHLRELATLLRTHLPADDPLRPYAEQLGGPLGDQSLRGYLSGSIDVVLRVPAEHGHRFVVVDYKTNRLTAELAEPDAPVTTADYGRAEMAAAMLHSNYPLQALLYSVVLHRYLRWRLPDYAPARHLGGVLYLFLRGMCGPETPVVDGHVAGVFDWEPPVALVEAVSDLLDGRLDGRLAPQ